jgi:hypothetical protein
VVVPKKIIREDVVEKVIVVPEKIIHEEMREEVQKIREKIIEVAVPVIQETVVEIPEIEYVEKVIEVPEVIVQDRIVEVPVVEYVDNVIEVPKIINKEKLVEVPEIEYRDVPYETIVEVPEIQEKIVYKKVPRPQYVEVPTPEYRDVVQEKEVQRNIPIAVEAITTCQFNIPKIKPNYVKVDMPLYVPRFIEVPIAVDSVNAATLSHAEKLTKQLSAIVQRSTISLCEIESLAHDVKQFDSVASSSTVDQTAIIQEAWQSGKLIVDQNSMAYTHYETATPLIQ